MQLLRIAATAGFAVFLIAACSGSPGAPTGAPATATPVPVGATSTPASATVAPTIGNADICSLLSAADLSAALGEQYAEGTPDESGQCLWNIQGETSNTGSLVVGAIQAQDLNFIKSAFSSGGVDVTVSGHAAFYNPTQGLGSLWVDLGGGRLFVLSFPRSSDLDPSYQAIALQLAELALGRM